MTLAGWRSWLPQHRPPRPGLSRRPSGRPERWRTSAIQGPDEKPWLLCRRRPLSWTSLRTAIDAELGHVSCRIGIGGICQGAPDVPRSYREAQLVLQLIAYGASGASVAFFDELGVFQILAEAQDPNTVHRLVPEVARGALLDYDRSRNTDLVHTLAAYLEAGGNYAHSARVLHVHRNTLRYRLRRIADIAGHDLGEPDVQFNLQLATRAWRTLAALRLLGTMTAGERPAAVGTRFRQAAMRQRMYLRLPTAIQGRRLPDPCRFGIQRSHGAGRGPTSAESTPGQRANETRSCSPSWKQGCGRETSACASSIRSSQHKSWPSWIPTWIPDSAPT